MRVVFDEDAPDDLRRISRRIAADNPRVADALVARIFDK
jgi:plasmid stabilization system protein ParE